jgi:immunoglobulin-binding protein 1
MMDDEPRSLKATFASAEAKRHDLDHVYDATSPKYRDDLKFALERYQQCLDLISKVSLFSPNESLEDIATTDLPYLLVDYWVAELLQKISAPSPLDRLRVLGEVREAYERYLHLIDNYSLLSPSDAKLFESYNEGPTSFSTISTSDPTARRNAKIANFKVEKELKQKLEYLRQRPDYQDEGGDEEVIRAVHLSQIAFCTHMTFQFLESLNREVEVLAQVPLPLLPQTSSVADDERRRVDELRQEGISERLDPPLRRLQSSFNGSSGPLLTKQGKPLQPFTLLNNRQEIQQGVFRPGHNLPTMTIDEYLEEEKRRGGIIEGGGEASFRRSEPDEDDMDRVDAETMKAREWDEFTEANPKGSGNTLNRG